MQWESPWGVGFPGWHLECSAMAMKYLGETIDIHTGGIDHIPVHHTNEIAQSEAATGKPFVKYWLHCAFLLVEGEKMSKSLGNIFTLDYLASKGHDPLSFRYLLLTSHYRSLMNFTWKSLGGAGTALASLRGHISGWPDGGKVDEESVANFLERINNDVDSPRALAYIWEEIIGSKKLSPDVKKATLLDLDHVLGLNLTAAESEYTPTEEISPEVQTLLSERNRLRAQKQWDEADRVRQRIASLGYVIEDTSSGVRLKENRDRH